jgi:glycosyltransferase involved in cell wall biosynthesis
MRFTGSNNTGGPRASHDARIAQPRHPGKTAPLIAILMCTYNGAAYLEEQLKSFEAQTFKNWTLFVSDDASSDATRAILEQYQQRWGEDRLVIFTGPCRGFAENFISLVQRAEVGGDYFAFSDQDDIWFFDKLERSIASLETAGEDMPALYCSRTRLVDANGKVTGQSPLFPRPTSFRNALVQSLAGANTMLINQAARNLLLQLPEQAPLVAHDWLTYLLVTGAGGMVVYDPRPTLDYRQHGGNLIGANATFRDRLARLRGMLSGRFVKWNDANTLILGQMERLLTCENREVLSLFDQGRKKALLQRVFALSRSGVYRQTPQGNLSLVLAACMGRI